ncbi:hypothetical protein A4U61_23430 [Streptomyces sp. H-KF8]|uniref:hypothetical protein n=1 Tax=Streptomyces sp. H-KF8 TaxID=1727216 RepID=UPI0007EDF75E|nr:hypothetical protein [Streptomyces sp. H-KF8]OBQ48154.1 hypothetical protein A4U61_23430 [Streptomyces sp. H-KF8]
MVLHPSRCSPGERVLGRDAYAHVDAEYPEGWSNGVLRIAASGEDVVSEAEAPHVTRGVHRVASFRAVRDGLVARGRAYWTGPGADPLPAR